MNAKHFKFLRITLAAGMVMFVCDPPASAQETTYSTGTPPAVPAEELPAGSQVLTRGPVHEAFAKPVTMDPQAPVVVPQQPPEALQEMPPAEKPAGADIVWVPGYWAWDEDRSDFIWVSGCWRNAPPGTYWVPGHWLQVSDGWEWIAGFWKPIAAQTQEQIEYLPAPPAAVEVEAPSAPPEPDQVWVPGCWYWSEGRYICRHGYWITQHAGWVWGPSHYAWTPRGYIFSPGHWDYDMDDRGVLFSPVFFPRDVRIRAGFVFSPGICVDLGMLRLNLFVYPRYRHYCFGDYYDAAYLRAGIYPWFKCQTVHTWYDPLFAYDRWHFGQTDPNWAKRQAQQFKKLQTNRDLRPARTYAELQVQMARMPAAKRPERPLVQPVKTFAASQSTPVKFERINSTERQQIAVISADVRNFRNQRSNWEAPAAQPDRQRPQPTEIKPAPATAPARPVAAPRPTPPETKPATRTVTSRPVAQPASKPVIEPVKVKPVQVQPTQMPQVRVTRPEQVTVPNTTISPKPSESHYIEKQTPSHPAQEHFSTAATSNTKSPSQELRGNSKSGDSQEKDRKR